VSTVADAVSAIRAGKPVILPTDTVYGLCADASHEQPVLGLARLKQRDEARPTALLAAELDVILEAVPELRGRAEDRARALLPGPYTLVLPNPAGRLPWLAGARRDTIGVRVPELGGAARAVLDSVGAVAATSANLHGGRDPARIDDVPQDVRSRVAAIVDGGVLPGTPSTVVDLTGAEPVVLRDGAAPVEEMLARLASA
jgi:L-threonylcarbamoyladenylate synthase